MGSHPSAPAPLEPQPRCEQHMVLEPAVSRHPLSHPVGLAPLPPHSPRRILRVREDPSCEGAKQGFALSLPFSGARFPVTREGIQTGSAGQAGARSTGPWAGTSVAEVLCPACSPAGHSPGLRPFSSPHFLGLLVCSAGRRHCRPAPQMTLPSLGEGEGLTVGWQTSRWGRKGPGARGTSRLWLTQQEGGVSLSWGGGLELLPGLKNLGITVVGQLEGSGQGGLGRSGR